jgi:hypothetical protein
VDFHGGWVDFHGSWVDFQGGWVEFHVSWVEFHGGWVNHCLTAASGHSKLTGGTFLLGFLGLFS